MTLRKGVTGVVTAADTAQMLVARVRSGAGRRRGTAGMQGSSSRRRRRRRMLCKRRVRCFW
jgi:hypothetical protein